jgi:hypothetical protein
MRASTPDSKGCYSLLGIRLALLQVLQLLSLLGQACLQICHLSSKCRGLLRSCLRLLQLSL